MFSSEHSRDATRSLRLLNPPMILIRFREEVVIIRLRGIYLLKHKDFSPSETIKITPTTVNYLAARARLAADEFNSLAA